MRLTGGLAVGVLVALASAPGVARAGTTTVSAEAGAEVDTNVERVETGPALGTEVTQAVVMRVGARIDHRARVVGGSLSLAASDLTRVVDDDTVAAENVTVLTGNARWLHAVEDRPVALGAGVSAIDALPLTDEVGARTFRNLAADGLLVLRSGEERALTLAVGGRDFVYKPDDQFDWHGPSATARLDIVLWQSASKTRSLELATTLGFEARSYDGAALVNDCSPDAPADPGCSGATDLPRRDRYQRAGAELTWVGAQVAAIGYQLSVIDSNSFGQSLARHRVNASATMPVGERTFVTVLAILQLDQYLDGLVVRRDLQSQEFTNIEDENRSSLQLRFARKIVGEWSLEARAAVWRNLSGATMELDFHRELAYLGIVYGR
jgi:hypothetical protein